MFIARYELIPYIKQITFRFKRLNRTTWKDRFEGDTGPVIRQTAQNSNTDLLESKYSLNLGLLNVIFPGYTICCSDDIRTVKFPRENSISRHS